MAETIYFKIFRKFEVSCGSRILTEETMHSNQLTKLLVLLLLYRNHSLTVPEAADVLWPGDETDNPAGALKNLVYRLRNILKEIGDEKYIINKRGAYIWNPEVPVKTDYEMFEEACGQAHRNEGTLEEQAGKYEEALGFYEGPVFAGVARESWMVPMTTYYHSLYMNTAKELVELYSRMKNYMGMEKVCRKALEEDNLDEDLHYWLIKALLGRNNQQLALSHYKKATQILYDNLGIRNSERLKEAYQELLSVKNVHMTSFEELYSEICEEEPEGVFVCDYAVFRQIYRLEARRIERMGISEYVVLLTLKVQTEDVETEKALYFLKRAMERLKQAIYCSLRIGDVASRYSDTQYILLLPTCSYETSTMVCGRIIDTFRRVFPNPAVQIQYDLEEVSSKSMII